MVTLASQVAIRLDNTNAYRKVEELMVGLKTRYASVQKNCTGG
jgi:hypothetical protein